MVSGGISPRQRAEINKKRALALRKRAALKSIEASSWKEVDKWGKSGTNGWKGEKTYEKDTEGIFKIVLKRGCNGKVKR